MDRPLASALLSSGTETSNTVNDVLRLTLLTSAVASATFVGTLAYAPVVIEMGQHFGLIGETVRVQAQAHVDAPKQVRQCGAFAKIAAALQHRDCP